MDHRITCLKTLEDACARHDHRAIATYDPERVYLAVRNDPERASAYFALDREELYARARFAAVKR
jgi:hypothetical protein